MKITTITATLLLASAAILALAPPSFGQTKSTPEKARAVNSLTMEDEESIRKAVMGFEQAWNSHDMKLLASLFREDAEFINVVGMHWRGRDAIVNAHAIFHEIMFKDCRLKTDSIETRALGEDGAIAVVTTTQDAFTTPNGQLMPKGQTRQTYVLAKGEAGWKFVHCQNVRVDAEAVKNDPLNSRPK